MDMVVTIIFLLHWILAVRSHQTVPNLDKLVDRIVAQNALSLMNADAPITFAASAGSMIQSDFFDGGLA